jgi:hypothetical protein
MDVERRPVTPHRRQHWGVEPDPEPPASVELQSPEETRREAKRLLGRDSAIILVGIIVALLAVEFMPGFGPGLIADETAGPADGASRSLPPGSSALPEATLGPAVDPGLGIGRTPRPDPDGTLPPTGTSAPNDPGPTRAPTPRPSKKPPATIAPSAPPTPQPTPDPTPGDTPNPTPEQTEPPPPPTDPPPTDQPT